MEFPFWQNEIALRGPRKCLGPQFLFPIIDKHADVDIQRGSCCVNAMGMLQQDIACCSADNEKGKFQALGNCVNLR